MRTPLLDAIELLVLDVDGVLTDGSIWYSDDGAEFKRFHVRDGSGLKLWQLAGKRAAVLTGRRSVMVERRAAELGLGPVVQGVADKRVGLEQILDATGVSVTQVAAIGDDLPDLQVLSAAAVRIAVADACPEVRAIAHHVTRWPGGHGAVRDAVEWLLRSQGRWHELVERFRGSSI